MNFQKWELFSGSPGIFKQIVMDSRFKSHFAFFINLFSYSIKKSGFERYSLQIFKHRTQIVKRVDVKSF